MPSPHRFARSEPPPPRSRPDDAPAAGPDPILVGVRVAQIADTAAVLFYGRLFELDPAIRPLFAHTDMAAQRKILMQTLTVVVKSLDKLDKLVPAVEALGRRHAGYGVRAAITRRSVGRSWTPPEGLGEAFTPEVGAAWTEAYTLVGRRHAGRDVGRRNRASRRVGASPPDPEQLDALAGGRRRARRCRPSSCSTEQGARSRSRSSRSWSGIVQWWPARIAIPYRSSTCATSCGWTPGS